VNSNQWFVCPRPNPKAETRLFFFPYAGAGPSAFHQWCKEFPDNIEVWITHYPGRGSRYKQSSIKKLSELVETIYQAIEPFLDKPFAFFGHSMGGTIAFEITRVLRKNNSSQPLAIFISACGAPHLPNPNQSLHTLSDIEFLKSLKDLNGTPSEILDQPELMQLLLPTLRADFELIETYQFASASPINCPIFAFGGLDDQRVSRESIEAWYIHTNSNFETYFFEGDHFFINTAREPITHHILSSLVIK